MRSGKTSHKHNLSCYGHELIPVCLSCAEPSKSFSSQPPAWSHPGKLLQQNAKSLWCCTMKILPSLFLSLSSPAPLFLFIDRFPLWDTDKSLLTLTHCSLYFVVTVKLRGGVLRSLPSKYFMFVMIKSGTRGSNFFFTVFDCGSLVCLRTNGPQSYSCIYVFRTA